MALVKTFIVEDSPLIRENLIATLEELTDVQVIGCAGDEASAVRWLTEPRGVCDLLILDIFLGSGSGLGVLRAAMDAGLAAKCVVLTNYATPDVRRRCADLGADRVFDKSHQLEDLIAYCARLSSGGSSAHGALG